ncbi:uncharacterized protein B0J16DRAFT_119100 [Fusarium flagelliforme]|uniref:Uncharacterized protein n=1 Tax=Fusarium flagelliforme TaxID=2675880 RepID=A0A395MQY1_9HYPO|nr:uncharacterized protein B0J16DRAFT_119100 [Fusarium flagelliforme]KAH7189679.1 hypothetical protein B0J16DRAFT_119100 [Fusarium flagelliforme]RFN50322.1 hypothetical protein FIE12Z_5502 [Fusarium flagelliforme]
MTHLTHVADDTTAEHAATNQGTPTKTPLQRTKHNELQKKQSQPSKDRLSTPSKSKPCKDEIKNRDEEARLIWDTNPNRIKPRLPSAQIIRDGVSEHAIKPTVAAFEKKHVAGQGFTFKKRGPNQSSSLTELEEGAVTSELRHRGIKTDKQRANFWHNLTIKFSEMAGSSVPLLSARLKAHEAFVEEALRNDDGKRRKTRRKAEKRRLKMEKTKKKKKKHELPQGIDAFLIPGGTDDEDSGSDSDNGQDLIAKIRAEMDKERRSGGGTSCGKKYRS